MQSSLWKTEHLTRKQALSSGLATPGSCSEFTGTAALCDNSRGRLPCNFKNGGFTEQSRIGRVDRNVAPLAGLWLSGLTANSVYEDGPQVAWLRQRAGRGGPCTFNSQVQPRAMCTAE